MSLNPEDMFNALEPKVEPTESATKFADDARLPESDLSNDQLIAQAKAGERWHYATLVLVGRLFVEGHTDQEIHAVTDALTTANYTVDQTRDEVQKMIEGSCADSNTASVANKNREIRELSKLTDVEYELVRKERAKELKMRATQLDKFVDKRREVNLSLEDLNAEVVETTEPVAHPVDAVALANSLRETVFRFAILKQPEYATAIVLWSLSTWFIDAWRIMPHLYIRSMSKGSGKTTVLELVEAWTCRSFACANISSAA